MILCLPKLEDKLAFLVDLFQNELPDIKPDLFPYSNNLSWLDNELFSLPYESEYIGEKIRVTQEFEKNIESIDQKIQKNKIKYGCLHEILIENSNNLVNSVIKYLKWLGFLNIRNMDEETGSLDEDIQVDLEDGLLVIEVKGIYGTSKDEECSQISKIRYRRIKERGKPDVKALYIVNHQRNIPAHLRSNPPFRTNQIEDAENDDRGLLTTYQLFKLYNWIKRDIITKEQAREQILQTGLVDFQPHNVMEFEHPENILKEGKVIIIKTPSEMSKSDRIIINRNNDFFSSKILTIRYHDQDVETVNCGITVGVEVDFAIKKSDRLYLKR